MRVKFNRIRWSGIYGFGSSEHVFNFNSGFNLVLGKNGSGKSSFLNVLSLGLFDKTPSIEKKDAINETIKDGFVIVEFEVDRNNYKVVYQRSKDTLSWKLFNDGIEVVSGADVKFYMEKLLGFGYDQFVNAFYLAQDSSSSLRVVYGNPSERLDILTRIFGLDKFMLASKIAKKNVLSFDGPITEIDNNMERAKGELEGLTKFSFEEKEILDKIVNLKEEVKDLKEKAKGLSEKRDLVKSLKRDEESTKNKIYELGNKKDKLTREWEDITQKRLETREVINKIDEYEKEKDFIDKLNKEIDSLSEELQKNVDADFAKNKEQGDVEGRIKIFKKKLDNMIKEEGICDKCGSKIDKNHIEEYRKENEEELEILLGKKREIEEDLKRLQKAWIKLKEERENKYKIIEVKEKRFESVKDIDKKQIEEKLESLRLGIIKINREVAEIEKQLKNEEDKMEEYQVRLSELDAYLTMFNGIDREFGIKESELKHANDELEKVIKLKDKKESLEGKLITLQLTKDNLSSARDSNQFWVKGFHEIATLRLYKVLECINSKMEEILSEFGLNCWIDVLEEKKTSKQSLSLEDFKRKVNLFVTADGKKKVPIEGYSGGEKQLICLSLVMAMGEVIGDVNVLMLDEIFGALDSSNRDRVISFLEREKNSGLLKDKCIMVITHNEEIKGGLEWDSIINVDKNDGFSHLKWEV